MSRTQTPPILHGPRANYDIANQGGRFRRKRKGVAGVGTSGDYHFQNERDWLYSIEYARDLDRNDSIAGMAITRLLDSCLQDQGIRPDPCTGDENANAFLKDQWNEWADDEELCDLAGEMTFHEQERTVLRAALVDGDMLVLPNEDGAMELMEAHRCRTPSNTSKNVVYGVQLDEHRRRLSYLFTKEELDPRRALRRVGDTTPIAARDTNGNRQVFHVLDPDRVSQTRGVSCFRRVADPLGMHDDIQFANLVRQQIASCFAIIRSRQKAGPLAGGSQYGGQQTVTPDGTSYSRTEENIAPGMEIVTAPGETIEGFSPDVPNPQYFEHVMLILKIAAANLGIPLHALLLDASQTNFSGWRGAHDQAREGYRRIQKWLIRRYHRRVWRWKVQGWLAQYPQLRTWASQQGVKIFKTKWKRPSWEYVEPLKDATADIAKVRGGITTQRRVHARRGDDFDELTLENVTDNGKLYRLCREEARRINAEAEEDHERVTWREMLALPLHEGLQINLTAAENFGDEPDKPTETDKPGKTNEPANK